MKKVHDILQQKGSRYFSVSPDVTVYEAIRVMGENNIGSVLAMEDGKLAGIVTERDYARKVVLKGKYSASTYVREIMTPHPGLFTVTPDTAIEACMALMSERKIRHLPVMQGEEIKGIISIGDVVSMYIQHQREVIEEMTNYLHQS